MADRNLPTRRAVPAQRTAGNAVALEERSATHVRLLAESRSANTWRAYAQDLRAWGVYIAERDGLELDACTGPATLPEDHVTVDGEPESVPAFAALGRRILPALAPLALTESDRSIAAWIAAQAEQGVAASTSRRRVETVTLAYRETWGVDPAPTRGRETRTILKGLGRSVSKAEEGDPILGRGRARALTREELYTVADSLSQIADDTYITAVPIAGPSRANVLRAARDRALFLVGFAAALRRSEIARLEVRDLAPAPHGYVLTIRNAKTARDGKPQTVAIYHAGAAEALRHGHATQPGRVDRCPVAALDAWLELAGITDGAVFTQVNRGGRLGGAVSAHAIRGIVLERAAAAGVNTANLSPHSLRAGMITAADAAGVPLQRIAAQSRHGKGSLEVVRDYIRHGETSAAGTAVL
jgi:integrase